jgi:hypothetical protein
MGIEDLLGSALGGNALAQLAGRLGTDEAGAQNALGAALPALLERLKANAEDPDKGPMLARALDDHDGSALDNIGALIDSDGEVGKGSKILGHVFGNDRDGAVGNVSQLAGIGSDKALGLLGILAPIIMGALGKSGGNGQSAAGVAKMLASLLGGGNSGGGGGGGLGALGALLGGGGGALGGLLGGGDKAPSAAGAGGAAGGMMGKVTGMLDQNKDGSIIDDVTRMATGGGKGKGGAGGKLGLAGKLLGMLKKR